MAPKKSGAGIEVFMAQEIMCRHGGIYGSIEKYILYRHGGIYGNIKKSCAGMEVFLAASKNHVQAWRYLWQHYLGAVHMPVSPQGDFS